MKVGWGIDIGVASLGFAVVELDEEDQPKELIDGIALVYPVPTGAAERTRYKSMRTQNRRRSERSRALRVELARLFNLDPDFDSEHTHPDLTDGLTKDGKPRRNNSRVRLRAHGLSDRLSAGDLARAILHLAKNRGQRLTRGLKDAPNADARQRKKAENERQTMANTASKTKQNLEALGNELGLQCGAHPSQLLMSKAGKTGATRLKKDRDGMPVFTRAMVEAELDALLKAQRPHHEVLTNAVCEKLKEMVFKKEEPKVPAIGKCRYGVRGADGEIETRLARGSDLFQRKRIYEEVNNLRLISSRTAEERLLDLAQRDHLVSLLLDGRDLTAAGVRTELSLGRDGLPDKTSLDIAGGQKGRKAAGKLQGHPLAAAATRAGALEQWRGFDDYRREKIAALVRAEDDVEQLCAGLTGLGLTRNAAQKLSDARLPATYSAAGETATRRLLVELEADVISNHRAEKRAGLESLDPPAPCLDRLPYYGEVLQGWCIGGNSDPGSVDEIRLGRIPNPVVHVALNRLRKTANAYLDIYGKPSRICVELSRDLNKSAEERERAEKDAASNRKRNETYIETLGVHKRRLKSGDLLRMKLHRMQDGECLYTGEPICVKHLFDGSVQVDHILPRATTRDDGVANLALVFKEANQFKCKRSPFEAFSGGYKGQDYAHILRRAEKRGRSVHWRFRENAMDRYRDRDTFQSRFLNDTRYAARMAARYLSCVCADPNGVISLNGRITSSLRHEWGLHTLIRDIMIDEGRLDAADVKSPENGAALDGIRARRRRADKIRWDHRHHLLDAVIAACTTRSDVQRLQTLAAQDIGSEDASEILAQIRRADHDFNNAGVCWQRGFREAVKTFLQNRGRDDTADERPATSVVTKVDHDPRGRLHEETNYGLICEVPKKPGQYVTRDHVAISELNAEQIEKLGVPRTAIEAVEEAMETGARIWWGGDDPKSALRDVLAKDLTTLRTRLLKLMDETPAECLTKARTDKGRKRIRARWATERYIEEPTGRRRFTRIQIVSLRILKGPLRRGMKPRRANPMGGNDRLIYFVNGEGDRDLEVVSTLDANMPGFEERWRREGGRPLFTLRKDDLVEMAVDPKHPNSPRCIYRTVSFSGTGNPDLEFLPIEEARAPKEVPKGVRIRITNVKAFRDRRPEMILCDPTGRVRWRGPRLN